MLVSAETLDTGHVGWSLISNSDRVAITHAIGPEKWIICKCL